MKQNRLFLVVTALLALLAFSYWKYPEITVQVNRACSMLAYNDVKGLRMYFTGWGDNAGILVALSMFLQALYPPLPKIMPLLAARDVFGWNGIGYAWAGTITAGLLAFMIGRAYLSPLFKAWVQNKKISLIMIYLFVATRFFGFWPGDIMYLLAGVTGIDWKDYIKALLLSEWPLLLIIFCYGENIPLLCRVILWITAGAFIAGGFVKAGRIEEKSQEREYVSL